MPSTKGFVRHPAALALLLLASTLGVMGGSIIVPVLEVIRSDLGVDGTAAGLIITAHGLAIAVASPATGWMIDRWGVRRPLAGGLALYGVAGGAGLFVSSYPALIASRLLFGAGAAVVFTGTTVALVALYRGPERDRVMGWRTTATSLGGVLWPLLAGALGGLSWHAPFGLYLLGVPLGVAALAAIPEVRESDGRGGGGVVPLLRGHPRLLGVYGLVFTLFVMMYALAVFLPQRLGQLGVDAPILVALFLLPMTGAASLVGLVYARLRARASHAALLRVSALSWVVGFLVLGTTDTAAALLVAPALFGFGQGVAFPTLTVLTAEIAPAALWGRANAIFATAVFIGQFCSPIILGPVVAATSITAGFLAFAGLAGVIVVVLLVVRIPEPSPAAPSTTSEPNADEPAPTGSAS